MSRSNMIRLILVAVLAGCSSLDRSARRAAPLNPALREELLALAKEDQQCRQSGMPKPDSPEARTMIELDDRHTTRMKEILAAHGWPTRSLVGEDGAAAAWLLVQHSDLEFTRQCLPLLEQAVQAHEAAPRHLAYLLDRVRVREGRPQVYGTQFDFKDGKLQPCPIEDPAHVDQRRRKVGLPPMTEYEKQIRKVFLEH